MSDMSNVLPFSETFEASQNMSKSGQSECLHLKARWQIHTNIESGKIWKLAYQRDCSKSRGMDMHPNLCHSASSKSPFCAWRLLSASQDIHLK